MEALKKRHEFLREASLHIREKYEAQGGERLPLHAWPLFYHSINLIETELQFIAQVISKLEGEAT